jgi:tRNA (cytidine56-2'-O)-methyltransferase
MSNIVVLRFGHRHIRDFRVTSHLCLISRALGASSLILSDVVDKRLERTVFQINEKWGGEFKIVMGVPWRTAIEEWKMQEGVICHLTMYGENIEESNALQRIKEERRDVMVIVGSQKVPGEIFQIADYNIAIGGQPHSECAALAVFLDRFFNGKELLRNFKNAKIWVKHQKRGKKIIMEK